MSVEFEPVQLTPRRHRLDPVSIVAAAIVVALAVALLKPWDRGEGPGALATSSQPSPGASASGARGQDEAASPAVPRVLAVEAVPSPTWAAIEPAVRLHDAWGIRAIVIDDSVDDRRFEERWFAFPGGGADLATAQVDPGDLSIVALGVTFPPAHAPLDARIWRLEVGGLEWIDAVALDSVPSGGAFLYRRPGVTGGAARPWLPGSYRIDVLVDGSIRRFGVSIPDRFSNVPEPADRPSLRDLGPLRGPSEAILPDLPMGLFATVDGVSVPLPAEEGPPLDEAAAWLDVDPGTGRAPRSFVADAYLPRATGLGVMLPPGSVVQDASVARLAPTPVPAVSPRVDGAGGGDAASSHVLFRAQGGGSWAPGVYRLSVVWADADGLHDRSWHVEMRPGPIRPLPRLLAAARSWARYAGSTGVILGTAEPLEGGPRDAVIRLVRLRPDDASYPATGSVGCGGSVIDGRPAILGFAYPADRYETRVNARILLPYLRRADQVLLTAAFGVPGLIVVAPARSPALAAGTYRFTIGEAPDAPTYALCLGMALFND